MRSWFIRWSVAVLMATIGGWLYHWKPAVGIAYLIYVLFTPHRERAEQ